MMTWVYSAAVAAQPTAIVEKRGRNNDTVNITIDSYHNRIAYT
jgi:hypothetical protein